MFAERKVIPLHTRAPVESRGEPRFGPDEPDLNLRVLWGLSEWVREHRGEDALSAVAEAADISRASLDGKSHWISHDRFEAFLAGCRALMGSDEEFEAACVHRLPEAYGPLGLVLSALSPRLMYGQTAKLLHVVSRTSSITILEEADNYLRARYESDYDESALMSLARDAQTKAVPTLWDLPKAELRVLYRDQSGNYEYELRWQVRTTWLPIFLGSVAGALLALVLSFVLPGTSTFGLLLLPLLGAASGHILDLHRTADLNLAFSEAQAMAFEKLATEVYDAKREAFDASQRHQGWSKTLQERIDERNRELRELYQRLRRISPHEADRDRLRGVSHDLRSPLQVVTATVDVLRPRLAADEVAKKAIDELERSANNMGLYIEELMSSFTGEPRFVIGEPEEVRTAELEEILRRRLRAYVRDDHVRTTVFSTREAPKQIVVLRQVLERVLDNLITNAAKYTESGSILVQVGGTPGFLSIQVADTGRGIPDERLRQVFVPGGSDASTRAPRSYGVGLSIVVRLMDEIGGRLEVQSVVGEGSTFWAHFPTTPPETLTQPDLPEDASYSELVDRVVTIRRA